MPEATPGPGEPQTPRQNEAGAPTPPALPPAKSILFIDTATTAPVGWHDLPADLSREQVSLMLTKATADNPQHTVVTHNTADLYRKLEQAGKHHLLRYANGALTVDNAAKTAHDKAEAEAGIKVKTAALFPNHELARALNLALKKLAKLEAEIKQSDANASTAITEEVEYAKAVKAFKAAFDTEAQKVAALAPVQQQQRREPGNPPETPQAG